MAQPNSKKRQNTYESVLVALSIGCALIIFVLLGARHIVSHDLGYHLAFGETFFESGTIVDHTPFIYTLPPLNTPVADRLEPGPGNWYDNEGRYRFPNANWLSQLFMYGSWHLAGATGLNTLQILIITGIFLILAKAMGRNLVPSPFIALALLLMGLIINLRFTMRPELFGYLCLAGQFLMLSMLTIQTDKTKPPSWPWVGGMVILQLLFVNFHSYFLLGLAITGTVLMEYFLYALWKSLVDKAISQFQAYKKVIYRLSVTLMGMVLACFINPWGWRLALLPFQTLLYIKKNAIGGQKPVGHAHPWDLINEFLKASPDYWRLTTPSDYAVMIMLILSAAAIVLQLVVLLLKLYKTKSRMEGVAFHQDTFRVRWANLFMIVGMVFVGLQMRRNVAIASLVIIPSTIICITGSIQSFLSKKLERFRLKLLTFTCAAVIALSVYGGYQIISGKLYAAEKLSTRFGIGISNIMHPIGAVTWLNKHAPDSRVWCSFNSSSTIHFFTKPHKDVPILTNTWAYPPKIIFENESYRVTAIPFDNFANRYEIDAAILSFPSPLIRELSMNPDWKMVHVEGIHVLYLRSNNKYRILAAQKEIRSDNFDINSFVLQQFKKDPSPIRTILPASEIFLNAGELDLAIEIIEALLNYQPTNIIVWKKLLNLYNIRGLQRKNKGDKRFIEDHKKVIYVLQKIIVLDPGDVDAQEKLKLITPTF